MPRIFFIYIQDKYIGHSDFYYDTLCPPKMYLYTKFDYPRWNIEGDMLRTIFSFDWGQRSKLGHCVCVRWGVYVCTSVRDTPLSQDILTNMFGDPRWNSEGDVLRTNKCLRTDGRKPYYIISQYASVYAVRIRSYAPNWKYLI